MWCKLIYSEFCLSKTLFSVKVKILFENVESNQFWAKLNLKSPNKLLSDYKFEETKQKLKKTGFLKCISEFKYKIQ
jgi:hypothetical protein